MQLNNNPYFNLLKKVLTGLIYEDDIYPEGKFNYDLRIKGKDWPSKAHTMVGLIRLNNIQECAESVIHDHISGDFAECGVWRGGVAIFMQAIREFYGENRDVWVVDSFCGFPGKHEIGPGVIQDHNNYLSVSMEEVKLNFMKYELLNDHVRFLGGWFRRILPNSPIKELALLHCDSDLYQSTNHILRNLYPKLSSGGYCIIDDYKLGGCRKAVRIYRDENNINEPIIKIAWGGAYWRKS